MMSRGIPIAMRMLMGITLPVQVPNFENSDLQREISSLQTEIGTRLRNLVLKHYKNLAKTIETKIESTKKNMFSKAEATNLPLKDKQRLRRIIENKITPIENRANKLKSKLKEKRDKKAPKSSVPTMNTQSKRHPNDKCGNKSAFSQKQAAHHWVRPFHLPPKFHHIPPQPHIHTKIAKTHRLGPHRARPHCPTQLQMWEQVGFLTKTSHTPLGKTLPSPTKIPSHPSPTPHTHKDSQNSQIRTTPCQTTLSHTTPSHPSPAPNTNTTFPTLHAHTTFPTLHAHTTFPTPSHVTHSSPPTSISTNQAPTTNVSQASPTAGPPTSSQVSPPELCPSDQDEYPLKVIYKKSRRFSRYNHNNQHKQRPNKVKNNDHCVNLSSCTLTKEETSILSKGLGFVPTPPVPHPSTIQKDINKFARTLRLKYEFQQNRPKKKKFKLRSSYIPPLSTSGCLEDYIYALKIEATKLKPRKTRNNLSQRQRIALRKLRKRNDNIIKKADKGSTVVIQDRQEYINTGLEHLSDKNTYSELEEDQTKQVAEEVTQTVRAMYQEGHMGQIKFE